MTIATGNPIIPDETDLNKVINITLDKNQNIEGVNDAVNRVLKSDTDSAQIAVIAKDKITLHSTGPAVSACLVTIDEDDNCSIVQFDPAQDKFNTILPDSNAFLIMGDKYLVEELRLGATAHTKSHFLTQLEDSISSSPDKAARLNETIETFQKKCDARILKSQPSAKPIVVNLTPVEQPKVIGMTQSKSAEEAANYKKLIEEQIHTVPAPTPAPKPAPAPAPSLTPSKDPEILLKPHDTTAAVADRYLAVLNAWAAKADGKTREVKAFRRNGRDVPGMYEITVSNGVAPAPVVPVGSGRFDTTTGGITLKGDSCKSEMYDEAILLCKECIDATPANKNALVDVKLTNASDQQAFAAFCAVIKQGLMPLMVSTPPKAGQSQEDLVKRLETEDAKLKTQYDNLLKDLSTTHKETIAKAPKPAPVSAPAAPDPKKVEVHEEIVAPSPTPINVK